MIPLMARSSLAYFVLAVTIAIMQCSSETIDRLNYQWEASIDNKTGLASSKETSYASFLQNEKKLFKNHQKIKAEEVFVKYPQFLGSKEVLFGLLTTRSDIPDDSDNELKKCKDEKTDVKEKQKSKLCNNDYHEICLPIPFVTIPFLKFGRHKTKFRSRMKQKGRVVTTDIPIVGGLLTCSYPDKQNSTSRKKHCITEFSHGKLRFKYTQQELLPSLIQRMHGKVKPTCSPGRIIASKLQTQIIDYRPSLAGEGLPLNPMRKMLYLSLQRPTHAYVMWRFHKYFHEQLA